MTKEKAEELVKQAAIHYPGVTTFYVTTDEGIYVDPHKAVERASQLSPGNPTVETVELDEASPVLSTEETETQQKIEDINAAEKKVNDLIAEIEKFENNDPVDEDTHASKLHVAQLKEQLDEAKNELQQLQPQL